MGEKAAMVMGCGKRGVGDRRSGVGWVFNDAHRLLHVEQTMPNVGPPYTALVLAARARAAELPAPALRRRGRRRST